MRRRQGIWVTATGLASACHGAAGLEIRDGSMCIDSRLTEALGAAKHRRAVDKRHACTHCSQWAERMPVEAENAPLDQGVSHHRAT